MDVNDKLTIIRDGKEVTYDVVFSFDCPENGHLYVGLTDHEVDDEGRENLYCMHRDTHVENSQFEEVSTDAEFQMITEVLEMIENGQI